MVGAGDAATEGATDGEYTGDVDGTGVGDMNKVGVGDGLGLFLRDFSKSASPLEFVVSLKV